MFQSVSFLACFSLTERNLERNSTQIERIVSHSYKVAQVYLHFLSFFSYSLKRKFCLQFSTQEPALVLMINSHPHTYIHVCTLKKVQCINTDTFLVTWYITCKSKTDCDIYGSMQFNLRSSVPLTSMAFWPQAKISLSKFEVLFFSTELSNFLALRTVSCVLTCDLDLVRLLHRKAFLGCQSQGKELKFQKRKDADWVSCLRKKHLGFVFLSVDICVREVFCDFSFFLLLSPLFLFLCSLSLSQSVAFSGIRTLPLKNWNKNVLFRFYTFALSRLDTLLWQEDLGLEALTLTKRRAAFTTIIS